MYQFWLMKRITGFQRIYGRGKEVVGKCTTILQTKMRWDETWEKEKGIFFDPGKKRDTGEREVKYHDYLILYNNPGISNKQLKTTLN